MTKDEAYQEYDEELAKISTQAHKAREEARARLQKQLKILRNKAQEVNYNG